ncbi:MAG: choice-of-anchor tandem repeat GloVer-containing protein [Candidatus Cybelea sp.]
MKTPGLSLCALFVCCVVVAACSQVAQPARSQYVPNAVKADAREGSSPSYSVLYNFGAPPDGNYPHSVLIDRGATFYGTTFAGGANNCGSSTCGTVFSITTGGAEKVLHSFGSGTDGFFPFAGLTSAYGTLYGTTSAGGAENGGTVFSITTGGTEKVLHSFGSGTDGSGPTADLINVKGTLYGTTTQGGEDCIPGCGTVFSITTGGKEKVLHSFGRGHDGSRPGAGLIDVDGTLYGTTSRGGVHNRGTVFSITTEGTEKVLHRFRKGPDGHTPEAGLTYVRGTLYGTTSAGGTENDGTVFSITTGGTEKVLHSFIGGTDVDGYSPAARLINVKGTLYGTTSYGGSKTCNGSYDLGCGTVFSITTGGTEKVLHTFGKGTDGSKPFAGMTYKGGSLVGTTYLGGAYGYGTVFSLTP